MLTLGFLIGSFQTMTSGSMAPPWPMLGFLTGSFQTGEGQAATVVQMRLGFLIGSFQTGGASFDGSADVTMLGFLNR